MSWIVCNKKVPSFDLFIEIEVTVKVERQQQIIIRSFTNASWFEWISFLSTLPGTLSIRSGLPHRVLMHSSVAIYCYQCFLSNQRSYIDICLRESAKSLLQSGLVYWHKQTCTVFAVSDVNAYVHSFAILCWSIATNVALCIISYWCKTIQVEEHQSSELEYCLVYDLAI